MWFSVGYSLIDNDTRHHSGQNVANSRGALTRRSRVSPQQILTTVMTRIVVDKTIPHAKPHSICFFTTNIKEIFVLTIENTDSDLKVNALHYANELLVRVRLFFKKRLQTRLICRNNSNHISICFLPHNISVKENVFFQSAS